MKPELRQQLRKAESGQAIILIAFTTIILLAALGMAIDGGGLLFLRHDASNATDAAVIAATYEICTGGDPVDAGRVAARDNGFDNNGTSNVVTVQSPPTSGAGVGNSDYVSVGIWALKPSYFIHLVYPGPLTVTTAATGYCKPYREGSAAGAIWAGGMCGGNEVNLQGSNMIVESTSGGTAVHSNNEIKTTGSGGTAIGNFDAGGTTDDLYSISDGSFNEGVEPEEDPLGLEMEEFSKTGQYGALAQAKGQHYEYTGTGTWSIDPVQEGIYYAPNGSLRISTVAAGNWIDSNGNGLMEITLVAKNDVEFTTNGTHKPAGGIIFYPDSPGILAAGYKSAPTGACNSPSSVNWNGSEITATGILYAPYDEINFSSSNFVFNGALIGYIVSSSASNGTIVHEPDLFPPQPAEIKIAE